MQTFSGYKLAEGPVFDVRTRTLYFVDILGHRLYIRQDGEKERFLDFGQFTTSVHLTTDVNRVLVTTRATVLLVDVTTGDRREIITIDLDESERFNDGAIAPDGTLYMGTMRIDRPRVDEGRIYRITENGYSAFPDTYGVANGMAFLSPDSFIHIDSAVDTVRKYRIAGNRLEVLAQYVYPDKDSPDGLCLSSTGDVLVALWNKGELSVLDSGTLEEKERMKGFKTCLSSAALSDDGRMFLTSAEDSSGIGLLYVLETTMVKMEENLWQAK